MNTKTTLYVNRTFSASHQLPRYVGPCQRMHGHTWRAEIWAEGPILYGTGMIVDFKELKACVDKYDHQHLNDFLENPTAENLVKQIFDDVATVMGNASCYDFDLKVRLWESENAYVEMEVSACPCKNTNSE